MQDNRQLQGSGWEQTSGSTLESDAELITRASALGKVEKKEVLELMVLRAVKTVVIPKIEDFIHRVVKEEIESAQYKFSARDSQNSGNETCASEYRSLKLHFLNKISELVLTGKKVKGENCDSVKVALVDERTGKVISSGPEASAKVEIVVLQGDSDAVEDDWTPEEFNNKIVREEVFLSGNVVLKLDVGIGLVDIKFKHASRWVKKNKLRLGAKPVYTYNGLRIKEAKTEPFFLRDGRTKYYKQNYQLSLSDDVWRLKNIRKGGNVHERLLGANIRTVNDFLKNHSINPERLQQLLGVGHKWDATFNHAQASITNEMVCLYFYPSSQLKNAVVFNCVGQLQGLLSEGQYVPVDTLSESQKADVQKFLPSAFEWKNNVVEFSDEVRCFYDKSSFLNYVSQLSSICVPSNSPIVENHGNVTRLSTSIQGISSFICEPSDSPSLEYPRNQTQPTASLQGISSFICEPANSPRLEDLHNQTLPSISIQGVSSSICEPGHADDFGFLNDQPSSVQSQNNNYPILCADFSYLLEEFMVTDDTFNFQPGSPSVILYPNQPCPSSSFYLLREGMNFNAQKRWVMLGIVLRSLRRLGRKGSATVETIHVPKKQRVC